MVARRKSLLDQLAAELQARNAIRCLPITQDLSERHAAARVRAAVNGENVRIRLLINNAAFGPWGRVEKTPAEMQEALIQLNAATPVSMCLHFLPDLTSFQGSAIINVSSPAALQPVPYMAVYAASKTFLHNFSLALFAEWEEKGVLVQTLVPGPTATEFDAKAGAYESALTEKRHPAADVVRASLSNMGRGTPFVTTAKGTYKQRFFSGLFPAGVVVRKVAAMFRPPDERG